MGLLWKRNPCLETASGNIHVIKGGGGGIGHLFYLFSLQLDLPTLPCKHQGTQDQIPQTAIPPTPKKKRNHDIYIEVLI